MRQRCADCGIFLSKDAVSSRYEPESGDFVTLCQSCGRKRDYIATRANMRNLALNKLLTARKILAKLPKSKIDKKLCHNPKGSAKCCIRCACKCSYGLAWIAKSGVSIESLMKHDYAKYGCFDDGWQLPDSPTGEDIRKKGK